MKVIIFLVLIFLINIIVNTTLQNNKRIKFSNERGDEDKNEKTKIDGTNQDKIEDEAKVKGVTKAKPIHKSGGGGRVNAAKKAIQHSKKDKITSKRRP